MKLYPIGEFHGDVIASTLCDDVMFAITRRNRSVSVPVHYHDYYSIRTLISGVHHYTMDDGTIRHSIPNVWYWSPPNTPHEHEACESDIVSIGIQIPVNRMQEVDIPPRAQLRGDTAQHTIRIIQEQLITTASTRILLATMDLIIGCLMQGTEHFEEDWPAWLTPVKTSIDNDFLKVQSVNEIAASANVHPSHLARTFRKHFGQPITEYIRDRKLEWCYQKVQTTDWKLGQIASVAGFADQAHFCRVFKRRYGRSPSDFR
ncbi:MAG: helix-turn-helix transcriptional regulator [Fimbriimonadaceae bacterium]|nr:helix-turn-helix transcriptional regulator [Fimbriimonadaceae bacterium]